MTYMLVTEKSKDRLILKRCPGMYSFAVAAGIFAVLLWLTKQPPDVNSYYWTPIAAIISFFASLSSIDNWEVCDFSKERKNIKLLKQSLFQRIFNQPASTIVIPLNSIEDITVEETVLKYVKQKVRVVTLISNEGHTYYLTGSGTTDHKRSHEEIVQVIKSFLALHNHDKDQELSD